MKELLALAGTIAVGVIIRFVYDFWVKPFFKREAASKETPAKEHLKALKKEIKAQKKACKK